MMQTSEEPDGGVPDALGMMQVVDYDENFNQDLETFLKTHGLTSRVFDYHVAAILGAQSSGKSTLLNMLFNTGFHTMDETEGRYQVTQGVWLGLDAPAGILALDLEGTDSRERGEGAVNFERKIALFALTLSEVLIINVWEKDVGRYNAANLDLLKTVIELDLQLFFGSPQSSTENGTASNGADSSPPSPSHRMHKTRLLFVLRDHVSSPFETLCETLRADVDKIWNTISKPDAARDIPITELFDIDFFSLPHKVLMKEEFYAKGKELRRRFQEGEIFEESYHSGIAADGFSPYANSIWETIRANRELDIPTQKEMLAHVRCEQLVRDALEQWEAAVSSARSVLTDVRSTRDTPVVPDLVSTIADATISALELYRTSACRYSKAVAALKEADLSARITADAKALLDAQLTAATECAVRAVRTRLFGDGAPRARDAPWCEWGRSAGAARDKALVRFDGATAVDATKLNVPEGHPLEFVAGMLATARERLEERLAEELDRADEDVKTLLRSHCIEIFREGFKAPLVNILDTAGEDVWDRASEVADVAWETTSRTAREAYGDQGVGLGNGEVDAVVEDDLQPACYEAALSDIRDVMGTPTSMLLRMTKRFDDSFRFDDRGVPRHFGPDEDIEAVFVAARSKGEELVDQLSEIRLSGRLTRLREGARKVREDVLRRRVVIEAGTKSELVENLKRQAGAVFIEAKRTQEAAKITTKVPLWLFLLVLVLGWNEFIAVLRNPALLFLTVIVAPIAYVAYVMDAPTMLAPAISATVNPLLDQARGTLLDMLQPEQNATATPTVSGEVPVTASSSNSTVAASGSLAESSAPSGNVGRSD